MTLSSSGTELKKTNTLDGREKEVIAGPFGLI
ncbi:hypothetical protein A943_01490 [Bacillus sp. CPSM8]|nr:hypothetical protein A943_01490 [Bacillus sp. CPSM8]